MKNRNHYLAVFVGGLLVGPMAAQAVADTQLIDYPGAPDTQVFGINDRGDVVGNGFAGPAGFPFVYDSKKGTFTDVPPAAGFADTSVIGIDDAGNIVGSVFDSDDLTTSGFIRSKQGTYTFFQHPDAFSSTNPRAVNNKGLVSGFSDRADGNAVGFIYDPKTETFTDIDTGPSIFTIAHGINSKGEVVGNSFYERPNDPCGSTDVIVNNAWLRSAKGTVTYFQVNGESTRARGINDSGSIVGFVNTASGLIKGFNVELDGSQCQSIAVADSDLLQVMGFDLTFPEGISNSGKIVGIAGDDGDVVHGFIATPQ